MNLILDGLWDIWCGDNSDVRGSMLALMLNKPSLNYGSCIMNTGVLTLGDVDTVGRIAVAINWWRRLGRGWLTNGPPTIPPVRCLDHNNRSNIMDLTPTTDNTISFFTHNKHIPWNLGIFKDLHIIIASVRAWLLYSLDLTKLDLFVIYEISLINFQRILCKICFSLIRILEKSGVLDSGEILGSQST